MWNDLRFRLRALFRRRAEETELNEELRFHFEQQVEKLRLAGMTEAEARRRARLAFGGHEQVKEDCREARGTSFVENARQDVRYAIRQLRANPTFAVVIVLTLALSIGANSAIFSVIDGVLIQSLPYRQPHRLVRLFLSNASYPKFPINPFDFRDLRARSKSFDGMAAYVHGDLQLSGSGEPIRLTGVGITSGYFRVLGLAPQLGREFDVKAEIPGNGLQVILSDRVWRSRFGAAQDIIGRKITLNEQPYTVIGVMPAGTAHPGNEHQPLAYGEDVDAWWPFTFEGDPAKRGSHYLEVIARLKPGVGIAQANAELSTLLTQIGKEHGGYDWKMLVISLNDEVVGKSRQLLLVLLGAVAMVLLIACANAANLMLTRAAARQREIAVRVALGAQRSRVVRQLLTESLLISCVGGVLGLTMALVGVKLLVSLLPANFPRAHDIHVSIPVFLFTLLVSVATGVLFGLAPALQAARTDPREGLHKGGRAATGSGHQGRLRNALVISEVGLACVLLIGAGLMLRSLLNLMHLNPGFQTEHVLTAVLSLPQERYKTPESLIRFYDELPRGIRALPGVQSAGLGSDIPWTGYNDNIGGFTIEGKQPPPHEEFHARYHLATPGYFRALGTPLLRGRFFTDADKLDAPLVLIINHAMAERYWPGEDVVGKRLTFEDKPKEKNWITIVGVVADVKDQPNSPGAEPAFWWPFLQTGYGSQNLLLAVRSASDPQLLVDAVRRQVARLDPALAVADVRSMDKIVTASVATPRFAFVLVGLFGALAIVLAAIGTYGVIAYSVSQRTAEFGLRMALGARQFDVLRLVLIQAAKIILSGTVIGVLLALVLARGLKSLIYGVSPADPLTFAAIGFAVVAIAIFACYIPARKATLADPMVALRSE